MEERIDDLLLEGLQSGEPIEGTPEYWERKKQRLTEKLSKAKEPEENRGIKTGSGPEE